MHLDLFNKSWPWVLFMCHSKNNISKLNLHHGPFHTTASPHRCIECEYKILETLLYIIWSRFSPPKPFHFISFNFSQLMQTLIWKMDSSKTQCFVLVWCLRGKVASASAVKANCVFDVKRYTFNFLIKLNKMLHSKLQRVKLSLTLKSQIFFSIWNIYFISY